MIMLENDDIIFYIKDVLYLCEKLNVLIIFDFYYY